MMRMMATTGNIVQLCVGNVASFHFMHFLIDTNVV